MAFEVSKFPITADKIHNYMASLKDNNLQNQENSKTIILYHILLANKPI